MFKTYSKTYADAASCIAVVFASGALPIFLLLSLNLSLYPFAVTKSTTFLLPEVVCLVPNVLAGVKDIDMSVEVMGKKQIWDLPVVNNEGKLEGLLHLHPVVKTLLNIQS